MKICIAHYRMGLTDGVSLQIDERIKILKQLGHEVSLIASSASPIGDIKITYMDYKDNSVTKKMQELAFGKSLTKTQEDKLRNKIEKISIEIEEQINNFWERSHFSLIFLHNIFSLPVCLPATIAFYNFLKNHPQLTAIGVHHDFYWDPPRVKQYIPSCSYISEIVDTYFPPLLSNLQHTVLSVWEQQKLSEEKGVKSDVVTDTFDFTQKEWKQDATNKDYLKDVGIDREHDLILLIASRIRKRKGIELGINFASVMDKLIKNRQNFIKKHVVLVLPNDYMDKEIGYVNLLKQRAKKLGVDVRWIQDMVGSEEEKRGGIKKYSLWDTYVYSDAVVYPSLWEGFGNQFLEALFSKKPVVSLEYPIYKTDIKPAGFKISNISDDVVFEANGLADIDPKKLEQPAEELLILLKNNRELKKVTDKNFEIAKKRFNTKLQLRKYLTASSEKYLRSNGIKSILSPLLLTGNLIACGIPAQSAYSKAENIISQVPQEGLTKNEFFKLVVHNLFNESRERYVTLELMKDFFTSPKSSSPLFIFIGGLAGKTTLSNFIVQQLGVRQPVFFDNEKYRIAKPGVSKPFLWKATYETRGGFEKTTKVLFPYFIEMMQRNMFDYKRYKKWCYFWEGIYLSSDIVRKIHKKFGSLYYLSVFNLPQYSVIKKQYILRWQDELGLEKLKKRKNAIDRYLKNISVIRTHIAKNLDPIASFVIESSVLEERLIIFYTILHQRLKDIAKKEIPGWIDIVAKNPERLSDYQKFLRM